MIDYRLLCGAGCLVLVACGGRSEFTTFGASGGQGGTGDGAGGTGGSTTNSAGAASIDPSCVDMPYLGLGSVVPDPTSSGGEFTWFEAPLTNLSSFDSAGVTIDVTCSEQGSLVDETGGYIDLFVLQAHQTIPAHLRVKVDAKAPRGATVHCRARARDYSSTCSMVGSASFDFTVK